MSKKHTDPSVTALTPSRIGSLHAKPLEKEPKVAVVGCGKWGQNLIRNFFQLGVLRALCDTRPDSLKALQEEYPTVAVTTSLDDLLARPDVDAVVVATPSATHYPLGMKILQARKHLYVEKPAATTVRDAQAMAELAQTKGVTLMVGHLLLFHPAVHRLRQLVAEGYFGQITYIQSDRLNYNRFRPDASVLWDLAPHDLSMVSYVLGLDPEALLSVNGHQTSDDGLIDVAHMELVYPGNISAHIHTSWVHPTKQVKLILRGTQASAILDDTLPSEKLQLFYKDEQTGEPVKVQPQYLQLEPLKLECQHFINCIQSGNTPNADSENALRVIEVLEEAEQRLKNRVLSSPNSSAPCESDTQKRVSAAEHVSGDASRK